MKDYLTAQEFQARMDEGKRKQWRKAMKWKRWIHACFWGLASHSRWFPFAPEGMCCDCAKPFIKEAEVKP